MLSSYKDHRPFRFATVLLVCLMALVSCECSSSHEPVVQDQPTSPGGDNIQAQRDFLEKERNSINSYIKDRKLKMERTGTGLYYQILEDSVSEVMVETEDIVDFDYDIYLMNGSLLYSSSEEGIKTLRVDKEDAEMGLHESLKLLGLGDKGRFILPSHLAFGVGGDQERVPPKTPLVYELKIININKSKS